MNPKIGAYLVGLLLLLGGYAGWSHAERQKGAQAVLLAQSTAKLDTLTHSLDSARRAFRIDTLRVIRRLTHTDSVFSTITRADTLRLTDTVKVTVEVVREAQETLRACRDTLAECGRLANLERSRADALQGQNAILKAQMPSRAGNWLRLALAAGAGYLTGRVVR